MAIAAMNTAAIGRSRCSGVMRTSLCEPTDGLVTDYKLVTDCRSAWYGRRMDVKPLRVRQAEATRSLLLAVARENFTKRRYASTSIDDIIQQAGVARGALYHHFSGKEALFRAVYETIEAEVVARVMEAAAAQPSPWDAVRAGLSTFLDACLEPSFRRIVVLDSVSVLQSKVMEVGIDPVELPMLRSVLTPLLATTTFEGMPLDALTYVALGGLYGASLYIARASDPRAARADVDRVLDTLISGLLRPPG